MKLTAWAGPVTESLNFDNNQMPSGWNFFLYPGAKSDNMQFINGRFEIGPTDNFGGIYRPINTNGVTSVQVEYDANVTPANSGQNNTSILMNTISNYNAGYAQAGIEGRSSQMFTIMAGAVPPSTLISAPNTFVSANFGDYHIKGLYQDGQFSLTGTKIGDPSTSFATGVISLPGFKLSSMNDVVLYQGTTDGVPAWMDNVKITTTLATPTCTLPQVLQNGACVTPAPIVPAKSGINYLFPLKADNGSTTYRLVTETGVNTQKGDDGVLGGRSTSCGGGCTDPFHADRPGNLGFYSLDITSAIDSKVVAVQDGVVVDVNNNRAKFGPVVTVYQGRGIFTEYREFTAATVSVGQKLTAGDPLGTYILGDTGEIKRDAAGNKISGGNSALHFQVKYNGSAVNLSINEVAAQIANVSIGKPTPTVAGTAIANKFGTNLSGDFEGAPQRSIMIAGRPMVQYRLLGAPTQPTKTYYDSMGHLLDTVTKVPLSPAQEFSVWNKVDAVSVGTSATLTERSPAYLWQSFFTLPSDADYLTFDFLWSALGDGDKLNLWFNDILLWQGLGTDFPGADFLPSGAVWLSGLSGQTGQLLFELESVGASNAQVSIRDLQFFSLADANSVPEPATLILVILALFGFAITKNRQRQLID